MAEWGVYALPEDLKQVELKTEKDKDDTLLARYCLEASEDIRRLALDRQFHPTYETRYYDFCRYNDMTLDRDLVEVETLTTQNTAETIPSSSYFLEGS